MRRALRRPEAEAHVLQRLAARLLDGAAERRLDARRAYGMSDALPSSSWAICCTSPTRQSVPTPQQSHWKRPSQRLSCAVTAAGFSPSFLPSVRKTAWRMALGARSKMARAAREARGHRRAAAACDLATMASAAHAVGLGGGLRLAHDDLRGGVEGHDEEPGRRRGASRWPWRRRACTASMRSPAIEPDLSTMKPTTSGARRRLRLRVGRDGDDRVDARLAGGEVAVLERFELEAPSSGPQGRQRAGPRVSTVLRTRATVVLSCPPRASA